MKTSRGFTTLELFIALTIVGLLIAVAVGAISEHATSKARRQAWSALQDAAQWLHSQRAQAGGYHGVALPFTQSPMEGDARYHLRLAAEPLRAQDPQAEFPAVSDTAFTLVATPVDEDEDCGALLLDHGGRRGVTGTAGVAECAPR